MIFKAHLSHFVTLNSNNEQLIVETRSASLVWLFQENGLTFLRVFTFATYFISFQEKQNTHTNLLRFEIYFWWYQAKLYGHLLGTVISLSLSKYFDCQTACCKQGSFPSAHSRCTQGLHITHVIICARAPMQDHPKEVEEHSRKSMLCGLLSLKDSWAWGLSFLSVLWSLHSITIKLRKWAIAHHRPS